MQKRSFKATDGWPLKATLPQITLCFHFLFSDFNIKRRWIDRRKGETRVEEQEAKRVNAVEYYQIAADAVPERQDNKQV